MVNLLMHSPPPLCGGGWRGCGSSENPSLADRERARRQGDVQLVQLLGLQPWQILRRFEKAVRLPPRDDAVGQRGELADVVLAPERLGTQWMRIRHREF